MDDAQAAEWHDELLRDACTAVAHAMKPRMRTEIALATNRPAGITTDEAATLLFERVGLKADTVKATPWWLAYGDDLSMALTVVCDVDATFATHLIGVASQAMILAKQDRVADAVLRLAERAATWHAGMLFAMTGRKG